MIGIKGSLKDTELIYNKVKNFLKGIELELNVSKTRITNINKNSFRFLGTDIIRARHISYSKSQYTNSLKRNSRQLRFIAPISHIRNKLKEGGFIRNNKSYPKFI